MKRLFLLRHAQAAPAHGFSDKDRVLTAHGHKQAAALGALMVENSYQPNAIYCSSAVRTRQTLEGILKTVSSARTQLEDQIYAAGVGVLFDLIQNTDDAVQNILIVAHNPSIYELAVRLSKDEKTAPISTLMSGYEPATLSVIELGGEHWADIQPYDNTLLDVLMPRDYCPKP